MINLYIPIIAVLLGIVSYLTVGLLRRVAIKKSVIDVPNERSSHTTPTPRGGGISIAVWGVAIVASFAWMAGSVALLGLVVGLCLVGFVGVLDDKYDLSAKSRMLVHAVGALVFIFALGGVPAVTVAGAVIDNQIFLTIFALLSILWLLNLYNFMDGINGIASLQAVTTLLTVAVSAYALELYELSEMSVLLIAVVFGFLLWNFPKAKIFMGDAGSGFLGFLFAGLALISLTHSESLLWVWLIALGVFIVDSTVTLLTRLVRRQRVWEAHCSHAYQQATKRLNSHTVVTCCIALINCVWLAPIAALVVLGHLAGFTGLVIAYIPLFLLCIYLKAGRA